jgi:hypothetical protein
MIPSGRPLRLMPRPPDPRYAAVLPIESWHGPPSNRRGRAVPWAQPLLPSGKAPWFPRDSIEALCSTVPGAKASVASHFGMFPAYRLHYANRHPVADFMAEVRADRSTPPFQLRNTRCRRSWPETGLVWSQSTCSSVRSDCNEISSASRVAKPRRWLVRASSRLNRQTSTSCLA